jgi:hypothetical protein
MSQIICEMHYSLDSFRSKKKSRDRDFRFSPIPQPQMYPSLIKIIAICCLADPKLDTVPTPENKTKTFSKMLKLS